jgi:hypothetical protein
MFLHGRSARSRDTPVAAVGDKLYLRETDFIRGPAWRGRAGPAARKTVRGGATHQHVAQTKIGEWKDARRWTAPPAAARMTGDA